MYRSLITQWIHKLRSRRSQSGEFKYKPLLVLAILEILDREPEHQNSFQYDELFEATKKVTNKRGWNISEQQFAHPYVRLKNDKQPIQVWIPEALEGIDLGRYEVVYPPNVKRDVPSIKIDDRLWEFFGNAEDRASFEKEIEDSLSLQDLPSLFDSEFDQEVESVEDSNFESAVESNYASKPDEEIDNSELEEELISDPQEELSSQVKPFKKNNVIRPEHSLSQVAHETCIEVSQLEKWIRIIERKKQVIFYGPPGTGKTFIAEQLSKHLVGGQNGYLDLVQFHPAYTYEDFVQGIRPEVKQDGAIKFKLVPGRFVKFCRDAMNHGRSVMIIDEINRANISSVFGELMYLLEYRGKPASLAGGDSFSIPENLILIGTMNTADRSIALVDYALRRRFAFIELLPDYDLLTRYHEKIGSNFQVEKLIDVLKKLNQAIDDKNYEIGISFFMDENLKNNFEDIWTYEIEPYIKEYFFGQPQKINGFRLEKVLEELNK